MMVYAHKVRRALQACDQCRTERNQRFVENECGSGALQRQVKRCFLGSSQQLDKGRGKGGPISSEQKCSCERYQIIIPLYCLMCQRGPRFSNAYNRGWMHNGDPALYFYTRKIWQGFSVGLHIEKIQICDLFLSVHFITAGGLSHIHYAPTGMWGLKRSD